MVQNLDHLLRIKLLVIMHFTENSLSFQMININIKILLVKIVKNINPC